MSYSCKPKKAWMALENSFTCKYATTHKLNNKHKS